MDYLTPDEKKEIIQKYMADPATTGGRDRLWGHLKAEYPQITRRDVAAALAADPTHQIHKPLNKRFTTRPIVVSDRAKVSQIDLFDMKGLTGYNDSYRYALTYTDLLSKYCAARAVTKKTAVNVNNALNDILDSMPASWRPKTIQSDSGSEFKSLMEKSLATRNIRLIHSQPYNPRSQGAIERLNRTLKLAIFSLMTRNKTNRWIDMLEPLTTNLNNTVHESTGYTPIELMKRPVLQKEVITEIHARMERRRPKALPAQHKQFSVGDYVRVAVTTESAIRKQTFRKKKASNWSPGVFQIYSVSEPEAAGAQPQYLLLNLVTNRKSRKLYWSYQLQQVSGSDAEQASSPDAEQEEPDEEEEQPVAAAAAEPAAKRRTARAWAPSPQALQNLAQGP